MDTLATFEATAPLGVQLIADLRNRIVSGRLQPGTRLSEQEIAAAYGLSRQPVRETFIKLAAENLVEIRPQRGTFVCKIDMNDVTQGQFVREAVEADIARIAADRADAAAIAHLRGLIAEQRRAKGGAGFFALDERFHQALAAAAGRGGVWAHIQQIKMQMDRVRHLTAEEFPTDHLIDQHEAIVEAIAAGDATAAEAAIRTHLRGVLADLQKVARLQPHCFEPG